MSKSLIVVPIVALLMASTSWADDSKPDYGRPGWFLGISGGTGIAFLDDAIQDNTGGIVEIDAGGSFNARGGYRLASWFALEGMYEGVYSTNVEILGTKSAAERTTHSFVVNLKFILPTWRIHPYIMIGPGAQLGNFDGNGPFDNLDTKRWDFVLRTALGVDGYITENWLLNLEAAPSIRFADYGDIPSEITDNVSLTVSLGVQYRF
jgi:opacity protein-like surface antigen